MTISSLHALRLPAMIAAVAIATTALVSAPVSTEPALAAPPTERLAGDDRYSTAVAVSQRAFPSGASTVVLAEGSGFADALAAGPAAAALAAPLLMTRPSSVPADVLGEIDRLGATTIIIVGGTGVVSTGVEGALRNQGLAVERVAGADRYATSLRIAERFFPAPAEVYIATGGDFPDALSASTVAARDAAPIILVPPGATSFGPQTTNYLARRTATRATVVGGAAVVSEGVAASARTFVPAVERLAGADRYSTSVAVSVARFASAERAYLASGTGFADALSGAVLAGRAGSPMYLTPPSCVPDVVVNDLEGRLRIQGITVLGGTGAVSNAAGSLYACSRVATDQVALRDALSARMSVLPGRYTISVTELTERRRSVQIGGDQLREPASIIKLFAAYVALDRIDRGALRWTTVLRGGDTVQDCLRVILHISDNPCHTDLIAHLGSAQINKKLYAEGFRSTFYAGVDGRGITRPEKRTTARDVSSFLARLELGELLSGPSTQYMLEQLREQVWRAGIPSGLPAQGVTFGNKNGLLFTSTGISRSDSAIVRSVSGDYSIAIMGSHGATFSGIASLARLTHERLSGATFSTRSYGDLNLVTTRSASMVDRPGGRQIGTLRAGTRLEADTSVRAWYRFRSSTGSYYWVHHSSIATRY